MNEPEELSEKIRGEMKKIRTAQGLSFEKMGVKLGMSRHNYHRFEKGSSGGITIRSLERYAKALGLKVILTFIEKQK